MANTKISQLTATTTPTGNEELVYALNNANGKMTLNTMKTFATTGLQPELVSWTNIKTINWNDILWSWNIVISWGGWGWSTWTISLNAIENIAAWTLISYDWTWAKKLRRWFYGTANTWVSLTVNTQQYNRIDSVAVSSDTTVVVYMNWTNNVYVVAIKRNWETRTVGTPVQVNSANSWRVHICSPYTWEFVVSYYASTWWMVRAWSVSWTTITLWAEANVSWEKVDWMCITRQNDSDTRSFVMFYTKNSDSKLYYNICTYDWALACTVWTAALLRWNTCTTNYMWVWYLWWWLAWLVWEYLSWTSYYTDFLFMNVSWATISWSNYTHLYEWTYAQISYSPRIIRVKDNVVLVDWLDNNYIQLLKINWTSYSVTPVWNYPCDVYPTMWRFYCSEDINRWIVWALVIWRDQDWAIKLKYQKYKWSETWLEILWKIVYWTTSSDSVPAITRQWNVSICSYIDWTNNVLWNLLFQDESDIFLWINDSAATAWSPVDVTYSGVATTAWLTAWLPMYIWLDWAISQTWADGWKEIWIATGSTDALLK